MLSLFLVYKYETRNIMSLEEKIAMKNTVETSEKFLKEYHEKLMQEEIIEKKAKEIVEYMNSEEYKERELAREKKERISSMVGKEISGYQEVIFEISFYSDLNCENGFGSINALGEPLSEGMVASNRLAFGTQILLEGYGLKTVKDRGSEKYFYSYSKLDVFVPRNQGESEDSYYSRVNSMGRKNVVGYIVEVS